MSTATVNNFINQAQGKVLVAGYGSLLSHYSRFHYSGIDCIGVSVNVKGWQRAWITRSLGEQQTYVGAIPYNGHSLNAQLIALDFDDSFEKREQDYKFTPIGLEDIALEQHYDETNNTLIDFLEKQTIYICETIDVKAAEAKFPVNYSYILTCLSGCYEKNGMLGVNEFLELTAGWNTFINDDSKKPLYPRSGPVQEKLMHELDKYLLK